jgi:hypothetical protein
MEAASEPLAVGMSSDRRRIASATAAARWGRVGVTAE